MLPWVNVSKLRWSCVPGATNLIVICSNCNQIPCAVRLHASTLLLRVVFQANCSGVRTWRGWRAISCSSTRKCPSTGSTRTSLIFSPSGFVPCPSHPALGRLCDSAMRSWVPWVMLPRHRQMNATRHKHTLGTLGKGMRLWEMKNFRCFWERMREIRQTTKQ